MKFIFIGFLFAIVSCARKTSQQEDQIYSRHLQRQVKLTIINTPLPKDKSQLNLLLLNDGQDMDKFRVKAIVDSLYTAGRLAPLLVVGIHAGDRMQEYGVAGFPDYQGLGTRAGFYADFVDDELYPYIKKKAGIRKFNSIAMAGTSLGGLSAFDIAWEHADKIDKVGIFSGSFWWRDKNAGDSTYRDEKNRIMISKIRSSRKRPKLQYWFYAGGAEEKSDRDHDGIIDVVDDTKDIIELLLTKKNVLPENIILKENAMGMHDWPSWSNQLPGFLQWAFPR